MIENIELILAKAKPAIAIARKVVDFAEDTIPAAELLLQATKADGPDSAAKKAQLVTVIQAAIDEPGGVDFPEVLRPYEPMILAAGIGCLILLFRKGSAGFKKDSEN